MASEQDNRLIAAKMPDRARLKEAVEMLREAKQSTPRTLDGRVLAERPPEQRPWRYQDEIDRITQACGGDFMLTAVMLNLYENCSWRCAKKGQSHLPLEVMARLFAVSCQKTLMEPATNEYVRQACEIFIRAGIGNFDATKTEPSFFFHFIELRCSVPAGAITFAERAIMLKHAKLLRKMYEKELRAAKDEAQTVLQSAVSKDAALRREAKKQAALEKTMKERKTQVAP